MPNPTDKFIGFSVLNAEYMRVEKFRVGNTRGENVPLGLGVGIRSNNYCTEYINALNVVTLLMRLVVFLMLSCNV